MKLIIPISIIAGTNHQLNSGGKVALAVKVSLAFIKTSTEDLTMIVWEKDLGSNTIGGKEACLLGKDSLNQSEGKAKFQHEKN